MTAQIVIVLLGVALVAAFVWAWRGRSRRSRWWVGSAFGPQLMLGVVPGLGLLIFCAGMLTLAEGAGSPLFDATAFAVAVALPMLFAVALEFAGIFALMPKWWAPRWYRQMSEAERRADTRDAFTAAVVSLGERPGMSSTREAAAKFGDVTPRGSWRGGWVYDPDTDERTHGMSGKGAVDGRLTVYPTGVVFAASRAEDALRRKGTVVAVDAADIVEVRVVPPRAGADGRQRKGVLYRSLFPRLVVHTSGDAHVFDVAWGRAKQVRDELTPIISTGR
ncbi:MAG: hypothetical protein ACRDXX_11575 [Stackebrandtia sp.]